MKYKIVRIKGAPDTWINRLAISAGLAVLSLPIALFTLAAILLAALRVLLGWSTVEEDK